jgi:hypothetical protein
MKPYVVVVYNQNGLHDYAERNPNTGQSFVAWADPGQMEPEHNFADRNSIFFADSLEQARNCAETIACNIPNATVLVAATGEVYISPPIGKVTLTKAEFSSRGLLPF